MAEEKKKTQVKKNSSKGTKTTTSKTKTTPKKTTTSKTTTKKSAPKKTNSASKTTTKVVSKNTKTASKSSSVKKSVTPSKTVADSKQSETKKVKTIEISQRKLIVGIVMVVLVVSLLLICLFGSDSVSTKYSKPSTSESTESESTGGNEILEQATKESGEISEEERTEPTLISVDDYLELYASDETSLVLLSKESCGYCQIAVPIIENIIYENGVKINHVDVGEMSDDDTAKLIGSDDYFSEGYGTPLMLVVGENSIKDKIEGLTTKDGYKEFFKKYGFME